MLSVLRVLALAIAGVMAAAASAAQPYPERPIHLVVNGAGGSLPDLFARPLAEKLRAILGQPVVVENKPGAGGILAMRDVLSKPADGYTLALVTNAHAVWNPYLFAQLPYDPRTDLQAVSPIATISMAMVVNKDFPASTLPELVQWAKAHPGVLNYASSSVGSPPHVLFELFRQQSDIDVVHIPFRSGPDAMNATLSGETHAYLVGTALVEPLLKDNRAKVLAVSPRIPELQSLSSVPTFADAGYDGFENGVWLGIVARKGTPEAVVDKLNAAIGEALAQQDTLQRFAASGSVAYHASPEAFAERIEKDHAFWQPVLERSGIRLE
ncbi:Bug family tripartite tricarboxylate transporter substrate binding protein [Paracandidimonas soli]|uniref:Bug family tripartite tricarboxylate transporter substrate binding protein n=1 Tax=Paracandidimonas soli TaxID=1917182 RepID=UPI0033400CF2